ncbi:MAG: Bug family tripartite tricarboxylate transporter substrate binding protein [bacterium]
MNRSALLAVGLLPVAGLSSGVPSVALAAESPVAAWPAKPLRMIVPFAAGGAVDTTGRMIAVRLGDALGRPVLVENRPGASGMIGVEALLKAPSDGYTLFVGAAGVLATTPAGQEKPVYDPLQDVAPVTLVATFPFVLVANPSLPVRSLADLVRLARSKPLELTNATTGQGTATHLVAEYLSLAAGMKLTHVPYKGDNPAASDIMAGHVSMGMLTPIIMVQQVKAGRLRALAVSSPGRFAPLPDVPTVAEQGYPGFAAESWHAVVVRSGTPREIVQRLNAEIVTMLRDAPDLRAALEAAGGRVVGSTPEQFGDYLRSELARWRKVMKAAGIRPQ